MAAKLNTGYRRIENKASLSADLFYVEKDGKEYLMEEIEADELAIGGDRTFLLSPSSNMALKLDLVNRLSHVGLISALDFYFSEDYDKLSSNSQKNINLYIVYEPLLSNVKEWINIPEGFETGRNYGFTRNVLHKLISAVLFLNSQNRYISFDENSILHNNGSLIIAKFNKLKATEFIPIESLAKEQFATLALVLFKLFSDFPSNTLTREISRLTEDLNKYILTGNLELEIFQKYPVTNPEIGSLIADLWTFVYVNLPENISDYLYPGPDSERYGQSLFTDLKMIPGIVKTTEPDPASLLLDLALETISQQDLSYYAEFFENGSQRENYGKLLAMDLVSRSISLAESKKSARELALSIMIMVFLSLQLLDDNDISEAYEEVDYNYRVIPVIKHVRGILFAKASSGDVTIQPITSRDETASVVRVGSPKAESPGSVVLTANEVDIVEDFIIPPNEFEKISNLDNVSLQAFLRFKNYSSDALYDLFLQDIRLTPEKLSLALKITAIDLPFFAGVFFLGDSITQKQSSVFAWQRFFDGASLSSVLTELSLPIFTSALVNLCAALLMINKILGAGFNLSLDKILYANEAFYIADASLVTARPPNQLKVICDEVIRRFPNTEISRYCSQINDLIAGLNGSKALETFLMLQ